jgi:hypothetical protein
MRNRFVYAIENHPHDSRVGIDPDGIVQTLSRQMGTGGNNTPFVLIDLRIDDEQEKESILCRKRTTASDVHEECDEHAGLHARSTDNAN